MEGAVMAPGGNSTRMKNRVRNSGRALLSNRLLSTRHSFNNKNNHNNRLQALSRSNSSRSASSSVMPHHHHKRIYINNIANNVAVDNAAYLNNNGNNSPTNGAKESTFIWAGEFTREVYDAICHRLGDTLHIPESSIQALFNDMNLYPSESAVSEMLQCARQCGRRNGATKYITFGEFCVFAREMQNQHLKPNRRPLHNCIQTNRVSNCEVFLGGSCNPTTWRTDTAIPELKKHGITFYNPQVSIWVPELVAKEYDAKQSASVLLYVVDSQTRSTVGMIEVADLVASNRCVVIVAQPYRMGQSIMGETISTREYKDLVEGQTTLLTLVKSMGIKVHKSLPNALQCIANILRNSSNNLTPEELLTSKLKKLREVFDSYGGQSGEISVNKFFKAFSTLTHRELKLNELYGCVSSSSPENLANMSISFERFCIIMAEFTTDNCDMCSTNVWASQSLSLQRQCSANNNSCNIDHQDTVSVPSTHLKTPYDLFLGGTCNTGTSPQWRTDAIPILKKHGISYYNPTVREIGYEMLDNGVFTNGDNVTNGWNLIDRESLEWKQAMDKSRVLLFVITNDTRSLTTMVLASYYVGLGRDVVLAIQQLPENGCVIANETLSTQAIKDYNRGRVYLADMAKRKQIPVFENITEAVQCAIDKCLESIS